jgi:bacillithiol biosynthesis cysteine-adding enzyme BshC
MLGGPLYTVYKTLTAIKLTKQLRELYPDYRFVPVFWLEGEDHDFEEMNKVGLLNTEHQPVSIEYLVKGKPAVKNMGAVGEIVFDDYLTLFFDQIRNTISHSEFKEEVIEFFRQSYTPGVTFNAAFVTMMNKLFAEEGIVFISSNDPRMKKLLSPVFLKEISQFPQVSQLIIQRSAELEDRYHAQIKTKAMNLFLYHKDGRYFIEPRETDFSLKGTRHFLQKDELVRIATETPEQLSPNVALRPICQDTLLPTLAYVAGPSEIAYFAQLKPVYSYFDLTMPVIYPRASATIVEERHFRTMDKYELELMEFFDEFRQLSQKVVEMTSEVNTDEMFAEAIQRLNDQLNEMKFGLNYIDPTLLGSLETTRSKIESYLQTLKEKVVEAQKRKHDVALRQVEKISNAIFPNGNYQERELNIAYFLNKYGMNFLEQLNDVLQTGDFRHQIITPQPPAKAIPVESEASLHQ